MRLRLDNVREALGAPLGLSTATLQLRAAASDAANDRWERAGARLERLADTLHEHELSDDGWCELVIATLTCAANADDTALAARTITGHGRHASACDGWADELGGVLRIAHTLGRLELGRQLGELLTSYFPALPHGPYAAAHFGELTANRSGGVPAVDRRTDIARQFEIAATRFDDAGDEPSARHCRLRAGACLLVDGTAPAEGRRLLETVPVAQLRAADRLWYAGAMARSPGWLDRVRAADTLLDLAEAVRSAKPEARRLEAEDVRRLTDGLLSTLGPVVHPMERDRLEELLDAVHGDESSDLRHRLDVQAALENVVASPIDETTRERLAEVGGDALLATCRALVDASLGHAVPRPDDGDEPAAWGVVAVLEATRFGDAYAVVEALDELATRVASSRVRRDGLRPLGLLWPAVLGDDVVVETAADALADLAAIHAARGPRPSYGWYALAANLFDRRLDRAAAACVRRALLDGEPDDPTTDTALARAVSWAVRNAPEPRMQWWLEAAASRFAGQHR